MFTGLSLSMRTSVPSYVAPMPTFEVMLQDRSVELVDGADAYQQEGPMTTFFRRADGRDVIDSWSMRVASFRTADLLVVRRRDTATTAAGTTPTLRAVNH
jgi:hypothetical protein